MTIYDIAAMIAETQEEKNSLNAISHMKTMNDPAYQTLLKGHILLYHDKILEGDVNLENYYQEKILRRKVN